jgi:hypothetical protein
MAPATKRLNFKESLRSDNEADGAFPARRGPSSSRTEPQMSPAELARATRAFDDPNFVPPAKPEPAALASRHRRALAALRSKARDAARRDAAQVRVTLERALLRRTDELANARGINRSQVIAEGLELLLAATTGA